MTEGTARRENQRTEDDQRKTATRIALITFALTLVTALVTLFLVPNEDKTPIDNYMMPLVALSAGYAYLLARRGDHIRGIFILLGVIALASASYPFVANNVGWQTAIGMLLVVTGIANGTLPPNTAGRVSAGAFALAILTVAIELFVEGVTDIPVTTVSIIVTGVLGVIYAGIILSRFRLYSLRTKLITAFIAISIVSVGVVIFAVSRSVLGQLTVEAGRELTGVARLSSSSITVELVKQLDLLRAVALNDVLNDELAKVNADATSDPARLEQLDRQWRAADLAGNDSDPLVQSVLTHPISAQLRELSVAFPEHIEIFVTDRHGALVASTVRTPTYQQAAEAWWRAAYRDGQGGVYISQPVFDEKHQTLALQIAVPIMGETGSGEVAGILRATVNLEAFVAAFEAGRFGETGRTEIYLPDGSELEIEREPGGEFELRLEEAPQDFTAALQSGQPFLDTTHDGVPVLAGVSSLQSPGDANADAALQSLGWRVVAMQDRVEALKIVTDARRNAQLAGLGILLLAGLLGIGVAQFLTGPLARLTQAAERVSSGDLRTSAPVESPDEIGVLAESFNRMTSRLRDTLGGLERRVAERTADLETARLLSERRALDLQSINEISRVISSEQKLDVLLPLITRLVSEKFDFYHVGIFIVDSARQFAVLQAANSPGGQRMLARGHKLEVGKTGLVGYVARTGKTRIALDVGSDAVFFNNPDLPETRSEMALPLNLRGQTIGVLDVQSVKPGAFAESDASLLGILAEQVAVAIENARLFNQMQQAREEAEALYAQIQRREWSAFASRETRIGYRQTATGGKRLLKPMETDEIRRALDSGQVVVLEGRENKSQPTIVVPVKLRGQTIGVLNIKAPTKDRKWNQDEINLAQAVSDRLALALDNARLLLESQRRAAKEAKIGEVSAKIGASINMRNVLQTAVEELGRALPGSEVLIQFESSDGA